MWSRNKRRREENRSCRKERKRDDGDSSSVTSVTGEAGVLGSAPSRDGNRTQITSERETHCGGTNGETGEDDLASAVLQH